MGKVELFDLKKWSGHWNWIYCVVTSVCVFRFFTPCYWREYQRLRKCRVILNRIVSPIFGVALMKILWRTMRMMLKKALIHKLASRVVSRDVLTSRSKCHFWGKISPTLCALKINNFYRRHPKVWNKIIVYFKHFVFILCGKNFCFIDTIKWCYVSIKKSILLVFRTQSLDLQKFSSPSIWNKYISWPGHFFLTRSSP